MLWRACAIWALVLLVCCLLPADERVELDRKVGRAEANGVSVEVAEGLAGVRAFDASRLELWGQAPALDLTFDSASARPLRLDVLNCMPGALLTGSGVSLSPSAVPDHAASCRFELSLPAGEASFHLGPPDAAQDEPFAFAVLGDVQSAITRVQDVFERLNDDPELRFLLCTGDLVDTGARDELVRFQRELRTLRIPMFSTIGNHETGGDAQFWHELFGPFNVHFTFKGVRFSLVDSGNATIDPHVYDWLDDWLDEAKRELHVVFTHYPPLDPVGLRGGGFRERKEGAKLLQRLGDGNVDALFMGHIHSYYAFSGAGVPSFISGGGGAIEERLDGIGRHYLKVRARPHKGLDDVAIVRVDRE
jgi:Icc protein